MICVGTTLVGQHKIVVVARLREKVVVVGPMQDISDVGAVTVEMIGGWLFVDDALKQGVGSKHD